MIGRRRLLTLAAAAAAVAPPARAAGSATMALPRGESRIRVPFELIDNRLFVDVFVNRQGPLRFVFDTGGSSILDADAAGQLGLPLHGRFSMPGAGDGTLPAWRTQVRQAELGALTMSEMPFVVLPLAELRRKIGFGRLDGLVGHEVLRRFGVELDFVRSEIGLSEPGEAPPPGPDSHELRLGFSGNLPQIEGRVDGRVARLVIDSGDRSSLTLFKPFVERQRLHEAYSRRFEALTGWGVGGPLMAEVTRIERLHLGALAVDGVTARLPSGRGGVFASDQADASVGTGVLKRLHVVFDYTGRRLRLQPNRQHASRDPVDHSGFWLASGEGAFVVEQVSPGSSAERAGLRAGDRVLAVEGRRSTELDLARLRQRWAEAGPGLSQRLRVASAAGEPRELTVVWRDRFEPLPR
jgi:hypothetical protein